MLPFGAKSPTVQRGHASWTPTGGTFEADLGSTSAFLPSDVAWTDRSGMFHAGGVPDCLASAKPNPASGADVEAAYVWVRGTNRGGGGPVVTWLRCL